MEYFLITLGIIFGLAIYVNRDYLKSFWQEHFCDYYDETKPPFCFECNYSSCDKCEALKLWENDEKDAAWAAFRNNELFK
jgi:hypothetical protein